MRRIALTCAFVVALVFTLTMAWLPHPPSLPGNPNDKIQHIAAFACLSLVGALAFPSYSLPRLGERLSFLGAIIEVVQNIPALHRDCDIRDWLWDTIAIVIVLLAVSAFRRSPRAMSRRRVELSNDLSQPEPLHGQGQGRRIVAPNGAVSDLGE